MGVAEISWPVCVLQMFSHLAFCPNMVVSLCNTTAWGRSFGCTTSSVTVLVHILFFAQARHPSTLSVLGHRLVFGSQTFSQCAVECGIQSESCTFRDQLSEWGLLSMEFDGTVFTTDICPHVVLSGTPSLHRSQLAWIGLVAIA